MSSQEILISIIRYIKSRYDLDLSGDDRTVIMRKTEYLARARKDSRLYEYISEYREIYGTTVVPILKKTVPVASVRKPISKNISLV